MKVRGVSVNIYVGNQNPTANLLALVTFLGFPRFLVVQEAKRFTGTIPGYKAYRAPSHLAESADDRSTMFLVRRGTRVIDEDWTAVPGGRWNYQGNPREPRVFGKLTLALGRKSRQKLLDVYGIHRIPGGPKPERPLNREGWIAEHELLETWGRDERNAIWCADWNTTEDREADDKFSLKSLAADLRAKMHVLGIDGFLTRGLKVLKVKKLKNKFGSDAHYPVVIKFEL
jgi:hypothetical protein